MEPAMQNSCGRKVDNSIRAERSWASGYLAIGKVTKVHRKRYTADVIITGLDNNGLVQSADFNEGKYACRIGVGNAGYDETLQRAYGEIIPIQEGSYVVVAFFKNNSDSPAIVSVLHDIGEATGSVSPRNILVDKKYINSKVTERERFRYTKIDRTQNFLTVDGYGDFELGHHGKSYVVGSATETVDPYVHDYEDLHVKNRFQKTVSLDEDMSPPLKLLAVFKKNYQNVCDSIRTWFDAATASFKIFKMRVTEGWLTELGIDDEGNIYMKHELDWNHSCMQESVQYAYIQIGANNSIDIRHQVDKEKAAQISFDQVGNIDLTTERSETDKSTLHMDINDRTLRYNQQYLPEGEVIPRETEVSTTTTGELDVHYASCVGGKQEGKLQTKYHFSDQGIQQQMGDLNGGEDGIKFNKNISAATGHVNFGSKQGLTAKTKTAWDIQCEDNIHVKSDTEIKLEVGGNSIIIDQSGVHINGATIDIG